MATAQAATFNQPDVQLLRTPLADGNESAMFGFAIGHLPDFLADHTLVGSTDRERLAETLSRWMQFVIGLRKWQGSAYALRFLAQPALGKIEVAFIGRIHAASPRSSAIARAMATDVNGQFNGMGFGFQPLSAQALHHWLNPFQQAYLAEVRQYSEVTSFLLPPPPPHPADKPGQAYVIHPFWSAAGTLLLPFEVMLRQTEPIAVNLYLEPTELHMHERAGLIQAAQVAQTYSEQTVRSHSDLTPQSQRDPQAALVSRIYMGLSKALTEPYLLTAQMVSPDVPTAVNVARAWGAAVVADGELSAERHREQHLPSNFDIGQPRSQAEQQAAFRCFSQLTLQPWGNEIASDDKKRLVYLVGSGGATALFRLPVSVRGGVPGIAVRQAPPDFEPGPRPLQAGPDELHIGTFRRGGAVTIPLKQLTRHTFITGFTGAGKTNTVLYLLNQLWTQHQMPFLVIEAAKKEYRGLSQLPGLQDLLVFTLGDETTAPFRLNPFELLLGVRLEAHIGGLQNCFDAALPQFGILPSIIAESLEAIYLDKGWKLTDVGSAEPQHLFPTMREMLAKVLHVAENRGYQGETKQNIRAAAAGRIGNLLRGSRARMFDCQRSIPFDQLLRRPVVLELNDLNHNDKALTMMFLLLFLREYREQNKAQTLTHVTVIEEAHNVMENVQSVGASETSADTRAKAVEAFSALLSEVRSYGEGIIISDQSPEKLAPDAVRNTNLQIAHQLRHKTDREAIAAAMIMSEAQREFLGKLRVGEAAVFMTGYDRATFMRVPNFKDSSKFSESTDAEVRSLMQPFRQQFVRSYTPFDGCRFCASRCRHRDAIEPQTRIPQLAHSFQQAVLRFEKQPEPQHWRENWRAVTAVCRAAARRAGEPAAVDAAWCYLAHEIDFEFTDRMRSGFAEAYEALGGDG